MNGPPLPRSAPVAEADRLVPLDVLRGVAVLGILYMNIQSYSMPEPAYGNPTSYGDLTGANFLVWLTGHLFFRGKFIAIFSMLFGAGIVLLNDRLRSTGRPPFRIHLRRNLVLLAFGLAHAYLLWFGDILYTYALCGILLYPVRRLRARWLAFLGVLLLSTEIAIGVYGDIEQLKQLPEGVNDRIYARAYERYDYDRAAEEIEANRGTWKEQFPLRAEFSRIMQTEGFIYQTFWWIGGFMLLGMALYKSGYFTAWRRPRAYFAWIAAGILIGLPLTVAETWNDFHLGWYSKFAHNFGSLGLDVGSVFLSIAIVSVVMLWCQRRLLDGRAGPQTDRAIFGLSLYDRLAAAGRMALTNYLTQTILCTTVFYGHGLGLFGYMDRSGQFFIVLAVWTLQLVWSPLWLRYFQFGPFEWLWRSLTYLRPQPLLRKRHRVATQNLMSSGTSF